MAASVVPPAGAGDLVAGVAPLRVAVAAYLARFKGMSRAHTESDLRCFLIWCADRALDPLAAQRAHIELYVRWMQEIRNFQPSTVSRRAVHPNSMPAVLSHVLMTSGDAAVRVIYDVLQRFRSCQGQYRYQARLLGKHDI